MAETIKGINVIIGAETSGLSKALSDVNKKSRDIQSELRQIDKLLKFDPKNTELLAQKHKLLADRVETTRDKLDRLKSVQEQVNEQFRKGEISEGQYRAFQRELQQTTQQLKYYSDQLKDSTSQSSKFADKMQEMGSKLQRVGDKISNVGKNLSLKLTAPLAAIGTVTSKSAIDFESAFAGVRKTVDATEEQFKQFEKEIRNMAKEIPQAATEIAGVTEAAGQLGIKKEAIMGFTRTMVDLGVATNMTAEQAATDLARLANITQMPQTEFDKLGSTIVALGNNLATTESEIVAMGLRLAGAGAQIGLTEAQIMAFAAALSSVGIEAEAGGSAFSKVMNDMQLAVETSSGRLNEFAAVAGMSAEQFSQAFKEDASSAILAFIQGLGNAEEKGMSAVKILDDMGITEVRLRDALLRAGGASDVFTEALQIGTKAWEENNALTKEAEQRYNTTQSKLQIFKNKLNDVSITLGQALLPALTDTLNAMQPLINGIARLAESFSSLDPKTQKIIISLAGLAAAMGPVMYVTGKVVKVVGSFTDSLGKMSGAVKKAGGVMTILKTTFTVLTGPVGLAIAAIAGLGAVAYVLIKHWDSVKEFFTNLGKWIGSFFSNLVGSMVGFGKNIMEGLARGISAMFGTVVDKIKDIANGIANTFKRILGIHSPSRVMEEYGKYIDEGLVKGMQAGEGSVLDQTKRIADGIKQTMERNKDMLNRFGDAIVQALKKQYDEMEREQTKALDQQVENERRASGERMKIYDEEYAEKLKLVDEEAYRKIKSLQGQIDDIDEQTEAEEKAAREQEYNSKVSELKKQLLAAETAEEKERIQKDLNKTISDWERQQLLEQRKLEKEKLREKIDAVKEETSQRKEELKKELEQKKLAEQEKLNATVSALEEEKAAIKEHFDELKRQENLQSEARKMIVGKNSDEIIALLETYNPKWHDAGQSFADSLIDGLNSEKATVAETVGEFINLEPMVQEQIKVLDQLEQKIVQLSKQEKKGSAGAGGASIKAPEINIEEVDTTGLQKLKETANESSKSMDTLAESTVKVKKNFTGDAIPAVDRFGKEVSTSTQQAVGAFLDLNDSATKSLNQLSWSGQKVSQEMATNLTDTFAQMGEQITSGLEEDFAEQLEVMQEFFANSSTISDTEAAETLEKMKVSQEERITAIQEGQERIAEIMSLAAEEKRAITATEKQEINNIQAEMVRVGVQTLSESELEQKAIMERMRANASDLSARQAAEVVQNSVQQKDEAIAAAEEQFNEVVKQIIQQRDEVGSITAEQADMLIVEAMRQKNLAIENATEMHEQIVEQAKLQAEEHINHVDWETGEVLSKWEVFKVGFKEKMNNVGQFFKNLWNGIKTFFSDLTKSVVDGAILAWEGFKTSLYNITTNIKNSVIGVWQGFKDGVIGIWNGIWEGIKNIINKITGAINDMISSMNKISFSVPSWVPGLGGKNFGINMPTIPQLATGGTAIAEGLALVGERGPELLHLPKGASVIPLDQPQASGGDIIQNITINSPTPLTESETARQFRRASRELALEWGY